MLSRLTVIPEKDRGVMVSAKSMLRVLEKSDLEAIHGATLEVLQRTGVLVNSPDVLDTLAKRGLIVDKKTRIVKMNESSVMEAVKSCEKNFKIAARDDKDSIEAVDGRTKLGPGAECVYYIDPQTGQTRSSTLADGILCCRLLDALPSVKVAYVPTYPSDVPDEARRLVQMIAGLINSSKCTYGDSIDRAGVEMSLLLADAILGDREMLKKVPLFPGYIDPISPLAHEHTMLEALMGYAQLNQPVFVTVMALAGGTAPASVAGLLVQQNAEVLSSIVIARSVTKNPKIVYGSVSCPLDMRTGSAATGSPEFSLIGVGAVQLAKHYGIPSNMGAQTDSKAVDEQAAYEKAFSALAAASAGADFCDLFLGSVEVISTCSPLQIVIDEEIASNALRFSQGIEVNEATLSVDVICRTGPMGNYLKDKDTMVRFRKEHLAPKLSDRSNRQKWESEGAKDAKRRAKERMIQLLNSHTPEPLETDVRKNIDSLLRKYTKGYGVDALEKRRF